jgi:tetratricopeptide (TPR) repeat protein
VAQARKLVDEGVRCYRDGDYDRAETLLKQAVTIYPFLAAANLVLAKILLLRSSARRDPALLTDAQRLLEMAQSLDPGSREAAMLLELCKHPSAP